jgi:maltose alpha-D-glucosyltransferase/alpha-amylase
MPGNPLDLVDQPLPPPAKDLMSVYLENARLLGQHTAELHLALADSSGDDAFLPEPFTELYRKALYHGMTALSNRTFDRLQQSMRRLPPDVLETAASVLSHEDSVREFLRPVRDQRVTAMRIRTHGDLNLRQFLYTGKDFVIIDFEGERARPLSERRIKRCSLRDVASMLRSFHYAAYAVLFGQMPGVITTTETTPVLEHWARFWYLCAGGSYLQGYLATAGTAAFMPKTRSELKLLLTAYLMEKAVQELGIELNDRPEWVRIPLLGILQLLEPGR